MLDGVRDDLFDPDLQVEDVLRGQDAGELERDLVDDGEKRGIRAGHHEVLRLLHQQGREQGRPRRLQSELHDLADLVDELPHVEWLLEEVRRPSAERLEEDVLVALPGHEDHRGVSIDAPDLVEEHQPVHLRHHDVGDDDERRLGFVHLHCLGAVLGLDGIEPFPLEQAREE